jgi:hypothetical protein
MMKALGRYAIEAWGQATTIYADLPTDALKAAYKIAKTMSPGRLVQGDVDDGLAYLKKTASKRDSWGSKKDPEELGRVALHAILLAHYASKAIDDAYRITEIVGMGYREAAVRSAEVVLSSGRPTPLSILQRCASETRRYDVRNDEDDE